MRKALITFIISLLILSLTGCNTQTEQKDKQQSYAASATLVHTEPPPVKESAEEIIRRSSIAISNANYHMEGVATVTTTLVMDSKTGTVSSALQSKSIADIPSEMLLKYDINGTNAHGTTTYLGGIDQIESDQVEFYVSNETCYTYHSKDDIWVKSNIMESGKFDPLVLQNIFFGNVASTDAIVEYDASISSYYIVLPLVQVTDLKNLVLLFGNSILSNIDSETTKLEDAFNSALVAYTIDKDYYVRNIAINDISYIGTVDVFDSEAVFNIDAGITLSFEDYGLIQPSSVLVPSEIDSSAITQQTYEEQYGATSVLPVTMSAEQITQPYGAYNGTELSIGCSASIFMEDGFSYTEIRDKILENILVEAPSKYPNATVKLFSKDPYDVLNSLKTDGVYGFEITVDLREEKLPPYTFGGLCWGANADDIKTIYGQPYNEQWGEESEDYKGSTVSWMLEYIFNEKVKIVFSSDAGVAGVNKVQVRYLGD